MIRTLNLIVVVVIAALASACAGGAESPTSPTAAAPTFSASSAASIVSCNAVRYQNQTMDVCRPITGQSVQPIGSTHFFPGRSDCLKVSCGGGCVTSVAVGVVVGGSCR